MSRTGMRSRPLAGSGLAWLRKRVPCSDDSGQQVLCDYKLVPLRRPRMKYQITAAITASTMMIQSQLTPEPAAVFVAGPVPAPGAAGVPGVVCATAMALHISRVVARVATGTRSSILIILQLLSSY
jgi:hypothetical protein